MHVFDYVRVGPGVVIKHLKEKKSCFLQGESAEEFLDELDMCQDDESEQYVMQSYEDIMDRESEGTDYVE